MHIVGLDIGGSKTHALSRIDGGAVTEVFAGSANISSVGEAEAGRQLDAMLAALAARPDWTPVTAVCAGAAGVDTPEAEARLLGLVQQRVPGATVTVVHDTHLILAAAGVPAGTAVIAGTGSVAWGRDPAGASARAGGWGYLLGDEGSGYGVARDAVRHALGLADQGLPPDRLANELAADCGLVAPHQLLDHFYANLERRYWARRAGVVFRLAAAGDAAAGRIVAEAAAELVRLVQTVHQVLPRTAPLPVVCGGGMIVHQPLLQTAVRAGLAAGGTGPGAGGGATVPVDLRILHRDPAYGALLLAEQSAA